MALGLATWRGLTCILEALKGRYDVRMQRGSVSQGERHHGEAYTGKSPASLVTEESRAKSRAKSSQLLGQVGAGGQF